jgi:5-methylthioadenosine/S-adenosylhomocysteine deaminase
MKRLQVKDYETAARRNIMTLIETGTTSVGEICTHGITPHLLRQSGLRAVIFREIIAMHPNAPSPRYSSLVARPTSLIRYGLSPHSPHTVSEASIDTLRAFSVKRNIPLSMHVAETRDEVRLLQRRPSGLARLYETAGWELNWAPRARSPVEYLYRKGLLSHRFLAVHAVHLMPSDIALLKSAGASVAHCPRSNQQMHVGKMSLKRLLDADIPVGLGTDSLASVPSISMWDEMRFAEKIHRSDGIAPRDILWLATGGGAAALGLEENIGSIKPHKKADLILLPLPRKDTGDPCADLLRDTKSCIMSMINGVILTRRT